MTLRVPPSLPLELLLPQAASPIDDERCNGQNRKDRDKLLQRDTSGSDWTGPAPRNQLQHNVVTPVKRV